MTSSKASSTIANCFIELARKDERQLTPMQLLKLVFLAHGWMLGKHGRPLINDQIEAWKYGPVIPKLYTKLRQYRADPVTADIPGPYERLDRTEYNMIYQVYKTYGALSGARLSNITHVEGSPWRTVYQPDNSDVQIPDNLIGKYYEQQAAKKVRAGSSGRPRPTTAGQVAGQVASRKAGNSAV
jgi:uncharacterized phage-associated protein